jgi:histidinol-phosphatase
MAHSPELEAALSAAEAAARVIRECYLKPIDIRTKSDGTPVTDADVRSEQAIRELLSAQFPGYAFFGEETGRSGSGDNIWIVDPIDGTKSFVRGYPFFSTLIALERRSELILGVSSAPVYGELAWAERGGGAFLNGRPIEVSGISSFERATLSTGNMDSFAASPRWAKLGRLVPRFHRTRGYGDFLNYHLLAAGKIEAVIETDINILDLAALVPIVEEAGGRFTTLEGERITQDAESVLATNGRLHEELLAALN